MTATSRRRTILVVLAAVAAGASGCSSPAQPGTPTTGTATTGTATPAGAATFTDPQGTYTVHVPAGWKPFTSPQSTATEFWAVAEPANGFTANVNVLSQPVAAGATLQSYLEAAKKQIPAQLDSGKVTDVKVVQGSSGPLGVVTYGGLLSKVELRFLAVVGLTSDGTAVIATLTAQPLDFPRLRKENEPFLLTLNPTP